MGQYDERRNTKSEERGKGGSSAFFFFALPLQDGADADAHGALFTQRWLFEAVFITARPQEQAGACGRALEVALAEIAIEALQATHLSGRGRRVLWFGPDLGFCRLDGHSYTTIALVGAASFGSGGGHSTAAAVIRRQAASFRGGGVRTFAPPVGSTGIAARRVGNATRKRKHFHHVHISNRLFFGL